MIKPASLRDTLKRAIKYLAKNPDKLVIYIPHGRIVSTGAASLSFEYEYTLELTVMDFPESPDNIVIPILGWLQTHQSDMLHNPEKRRDGFKYESEVLSNNACDIQFSIVLTESVGVQIVDGVLRATHFDEPPPIGVDDIDWEGITIPGVVEQIPDDSLLTGGGEFEQLTDSDNEYVEYE